MNIYIHLEWTKRELDGNLLLAILAAEKGANVFLADYASFDFLLKKNLIKPGIFHTKSLVHDDNKQQFIEKLKKLNFTITSIDEESGLVHNEINSFIERRFTSNALEIVDKVFCWGKYDFEGLNTKYQNFKNKFVMSGSPRVDLWKKRFNPFWENNIKNFKDKYVLISSNFGIVNSDIAIWKTYYKLKKAGYFERNNSTEKNFVDRVSMSFKLFYKFVEAINFLTENCKNINFLVRPHPQESVDVWKYLLDKRENLIIENRETMGSVLKDSFLIMQNGCTTAYEAVLKDIPVISYHPLEEEEIHGKPSNELGMKVDNIQDLQLQIENVHKKKIEEKDFCKKEIAVKKLNFNEETLSSNMIIDTWLSYLKDFSKNNNWNIIFLSLFFFQLMKKTIFNILTFNKSKNKILGQTKFENEKKKLLSK